MVSSKNGPSRGSGLSKRASTWRSPFTSKPSRATSRPGMKPSTRTCRAASPSAAASGVRRILSSRRTAPTNWASPSARITPRLAESMRGLTTHGNAVRRASTTGSSSKERRAYGGTGTPSPRSSVRIRYLSRAAAVDLRGLLPDHCLDAVLQRDVGHAAPLTATAHLEVDHLVPDVDERHHPAVAGHGGVDRRVEQVLDLRSDPGVLLLFPITPHTLIGHGVAASLLLKRFRCRRTRRRFM